MVPSCQGPLGQRLHTRRLLVSLHYQSSPRVSFTLAPTQQGSPHRTICLGVPYCRPPCPAKHSFARPRLPPPPDLDISWWGVSPICADDIDHARQLQRSHSNWCTASAECACRKRHCADEAGCSIALECRDRRRLPSSTRSALQRLASLAIDRPCTQHCIAAVQSLRPLQYDYASRTALDRPLQRPLHDHMPPARVRL